MMDDLKVKTEQLFSGIDIQGVKPFTEAQSFLLTDGSTEIGIAIIEELLNNTDAEVWVISQSDDLNDFQIGMKSALMEEKTQGKDRNIRLHIVRGKLDAEWFGLEQEKWNELAGRIDVVIHNRCVNSFIKPYRLLFQTNVSPIFEIIKFAFSNKIKKIVYFSMANVLCGDNDGGECIYNEYDEVDRASSNYGLVQTKVAVESVLAYARKKGLPVLVMRFPHVLSSPKAKKWDRRDFLLLRIKLCIQMAIIPETDFSYYLIPEKTLAEIIVKFARYEEGFFIPTIPFGLTWTAILEAFLHLANVDYKTVSLDCFVDSAIGYIKKTSDRELATVVPFLRMNHAGFDCPRFNNDSFRETVLKYNLSFPSLQQIVGDVLDGPIGEWLVCNKKK